jgi:photosystem II stability/assembly factor-like uncharacterized protein
MKRTFTFLILLIICSITNAQWVQTTEINNGYITCIATDGNIIYAGASSAGVFRSTDNGRNWTSLGLMNTNVISLGVNGNNIFAVTLVNGLYRSTNNGDNWSLVNDGLHSTNRYITSFAFSGNNIFVGTNGDGVYISTNNGTNWNQVNNEQTGISTLSLAINKENLFAGTYSNGAIFHSTNNGLTWTKVNDGMLTGMNVALAFLDTIIFAGSPLNYEGGGGVYRSTDYGLNWTQVNNGFPTDFFFYNFISSGSNIFAATNVGIYLSIDNGNNWTRDNTGMTNYGFDFLAICRNNIFASTYGGGIWYRPIQDLVWISTKQVDGFNLIQNYPNPFNPITEIRYSIEKEGNVQLNIYNLLGSRVSTIVNEYKQVGNYSVQFNGSNLPSGIYFYKLEAGQFSQVKKMLLLK